MPLDFDPYPSDTLADLFTSQWTMQEHPIFLVDTAGISMRFSDDVPGAREAASGCSPLGRPSWDLSSRYFEVPGCKVFISTLEFFWGPLGCSGDTQAHHYHHRQASCRWPQISRICCRLGRSESYLNLGISMHFLSVQSRVVGSCWVLSFELGSVYLYHPWK